jgi:Leucine-rich repeat (LRR) protein
MNIILEKRENIIRENNTAQSELLGILDNLFKSVPDLWINHSLHGDLDFSVIRDLGFSSIHSIYLKKGEITSIRNIPEGILHIECIDNYLTDIDDLPHSLEKLNLDFNYLERIDFKKTPRLKKAILSHNKLVEIENLPVSLEELYLDYNEIEELDLQHLVKLRVLHVKNNKSIVLKNIPPSLVDLQMDLDPFQSTEKHDEETEEEQESRDNQIEYREAISEYFKLKQKYEEKTKKEK